MKARGAVARHRYLNPCLCLRDSTQRPQRWLPAGDRGLSVPVGVVLGPIERRRLLIVAIFAVAAAALLDFVFRTIFKLDLN